MEPPAYMSAAPWTVLTVLSMAADCSLMLSFLLLHCVCGRVINPAEH